MDMMPGPDKWNDGCFKDLQTLHGIYRDYMKHEDDLLNQRTTWFLIIQGFLFATYGVVGQWTAGASPDTHYVERQWMVVVLSLVAALIAAAAFKSIAAANNAIDQLCEQWQKILDVYPSPMKNLLPSIAGGGHDTAKENGKLPAMRIPLVIGAAWVLIACMALWSHYHAPTVRTNRSESMQQSVPAVLPQPQAFPTEKKP